ncbi:hypothetical protein FGF66_12280 [Chlorobaculum thiosulfatiphilum]|uniref:Uncharacterized protein n=1 Tax=Chlorobaculum thiosulfatiphilum TaxID=115852 RepID=A0A5C4RXM5_CHLTI|nr:hypothetical protein [Chlorobaculum thiosulfatiphilum]TNJ36056.1 hypothetical protein FGF66_12280 [Chlorobaculum thiosulfatiphilum]
MEQPANTPSAQVPLGAASPSATLKPGVSLEVPGVKLVISGSVALILVIATVITLSVLSTYLVTSKSENLRTVISSLNPKAGTEVSKSGREMLQFWLPDTAEYRKNVQKFESWLSANNNWWGKVPMANIRTINGEKIVMNGYLYQAQEPIDGSEIIGNPQQAIQAQAVKLIGISDLNLIWTELTSYDVR